VDRLTPSSAFDDLKNILKFYFIRQGKGIFCEGILAAGTEKTGETGGERQKEGGAEQECDRTMLPS
jgi:hypothetical protein